MAKRPAPDAFPHKCVDEREPLLSEFTSSDMDGNPIPHIFCHKCRAHLFRGEFYDVKAWDDFVNMTEEEWLAYHNQ